MKIREGEPAVLLHEERPYSMGNVVLYMMSGVMACFVASLMLMLFSIGEPGVGDVSSLVRPESQTISVLEPAQEAPGMPVRGDSAGSGAEASALDMQHSMSDVKQLVSFLANILTLVGIFAIFKGLYLKSPQNPFFQGGDVRRLLSAPLCGVCVLV